MKKFSLVIMFLAGSMAISAREVKNRLSVQDTKAGIEGACLLFDSLQADVVDAALSDRKALMDACAHTIVSIKKSNDEVLKNHEIAMGSEKVTFNVADLIVCMSCIFEQMLQEAQKNGQVTDQDRINIAYMLDRLEGVLEVLKKKGVTAQQKKEFLNENYLAFLCAISAILQQSK